MQKRICATLRGSSQSQILIDNAKVKAETAIHSAVVEANSMAAEISLRILGKSENYMRPNDVLWYLTMNNTKASPDLVSRGLPIRQHYEGKPEDRDFGKRDPLKYAHEHRQEILGELAGMVVRWNQMGRPQGEQKHRLTGWARVIGGIMSANGFPEFLTNLDTAAAEFNTALDALAALAEAAVSAKGEFVVYLTQGNGIYEEQEVMAQSASKWESLFKKAGIETERLDAAKSEKARTTILGNFLAQNVGREVPIEHKGITGKATLRMEVGRGKQKQYWFEVRWDGADGASPDMTKDAKSGKSPTPTNVTTQTHRGSESTPHGAMNAGRSKTTGVPVKKAVAKAIEKPNTKTAEKPNDRDLARSGGVSEEKRSTETADKQTSSTGASPVNTLPATRQRRREDVQGNSEAWD